jgi:hypothetical protein
MRIAHWFLGIAAALLAAGSVSASLEAPWVERDAAGSARVHLYFFWSARCPHCLAARPFVESVPAARPWVVLHSLEVTENPDHARRYIAMAESLGETANAVPALIACGAMEVGWDEEHAGPALLARLDACREAALRGALPAAAGPPPARVQVPILGELDAANVSLPVFTAVLAGLDAFNPCAFFVLLFLLSLLAHQKSRARMAAIGGIFVLASGLMYFAFMAAWLNLFQLIGALGWVTLAAGLLAIAVGAINVKDFFVLGRGPSLSIPEARKGDLYRRARAVLSAQSLPAMLAATVVLALAANFYELLCTAGFPMVYTRVLTMSEASPVARYAWLALYNLIYVLPLGLIVLAFVGTLGARKLTEREGRLLKLLSGVMMLELGLLLLVAPERLASLAASALLLALALAVTGTAAWATRARRSLR